MPFLLLDDATDEATRRLQAFGQNLLQAPQQTQNTLQDITGRLQDFGDQQLQGLNQPPFPGALGTTPGAPPPVPGVTLPQPPPELVQLNQPPFPGVAAPGAPAPVPPIQEIQPQGVTDITQRLQEHGTQVLQAAQQQLQQLPQVQPIAPISGPPAPGQPQAGGDLQDYARQVANKYGIDPDIFVRQIQQESGFNPSAQSPAGATGIAQFMPDTARGMGIDPSDPYAALDAAARLDASNLQKYGGDYSKALAAYNAGGGNVDKYGGVPPFQETQTYVSNILGGAKQAVQGAVQGAQQAVQGAVQGGQQVLGQISQFGDKQLSAAEAMAACGPAAAVRFAQMFGRNPTLREAVDLASQVGWSAAQGMAGLGSESALFDKMGIPHREVGADWTALAREASSGNPVTISTPGHYFTADNYDPSTGAFHVGSSGTDLRGGSEWMTPDQMQARMGQLQGGLAVDHPQVPGDSPLASGAQQAVNSAMDLGRRGMTLLSEAPAAAAQWYGQQQQQAKETLGQAGIEYQPTDWSKALTDPNFIAASGFDPLGGLQRGIPDVVGGIQQRDVGRTLGGLFQTGTTLASALPGAGGPGGGAAEATTRALETIDRLFPPEVAHAAELPEAARMSVGELADALSQYPEDIKQGLRNFVQQQTEAGQSGADINDTLRRWVADNPLEAPPTPAQPTTTVRDLDEAISRAGGGAPAPAGGEPPPLEALTSRGAPPPETPPVAGPVRAAPEQPGIVGRVLGAPGAAASRFGSLVASALGPTESLPAETSGVLKNYANMVGRQSDAAQVIAENQMRSAGARLDIPAVAEQVQQMRGDLRDEAARTLVRNLQDQGKAAPIANAPRDFRTVTDNPNTYLANYAFSPDVVGPIKAVTDMSQIAGNPLGSAILKTLGTAKGTLFSLSNLHTLTEGLNAAFTSPQTLANYARAFVSDSFAQGLRGSMAETIDKAAAAGVTQLAERVRPEDVGSQIGNQLWRRVVSGGVSGAGGAAAGYTETKLSGGSEEEARANALKGGVAGLALGGIPLGGRGTIPEILQSALWDRAVPLAKATAWDALTKGGMDAGQAADVVNQRFGGLNYAAMGRNPTLLDAQRLTLMASDWNEATVRQLGSAIFGGEGSGVTRAFLAKTIAGMMTATEAANYAFSGHSTLENQPGHQFEVELHDPNGGYLHFGILPGNVQAYLNLANNLVSDPNRQRGNTLTNFVVNRLSAPVGAGIDAALTAAGKPPFWVAKAGPVAYGEQVAPVGIQQAFQSTLRGGLNPAVSAGLAAAGLNPRFSAAGGGATGFTSPSTSRASSRSLSSKVGSKRQ